jgi:hypothetical protein
MTRTMYDSTVAGDIPPAAEIVAGYIDGPFAWTSEEWDKFPHAVHVTISTSGEGNAGDVLDVEADDATPAQAGPWIARRKLAGLHRPTIYCDRDSIPAVRAGTGKFILGKDYDIWVADWTKVPHQVMAPGTPAASCAATQYLNVPHYDETIIYDGGWPHREAPAAPPTKADAVAALKTLTEYVGS